MQLQLPIGQLPISQTTVPTMTKRWQRAPNSKAKLRGKRNGKTHKP
jgi:hypothetical protein